MRRYSVVLIILMASIVFFAQFYSANRASATIQCFQCHGSNNTSDYRPIDSPYRNITTGGFQGNHRTHMDGGATPATCAKCHPGSGGYPTLHRNGTIEISNNINNSTIPAVYRNGSTTSFPQTPSPNLGTCTNVNCHFERETPVWGSAYLTAPGGCNVCHGAPPLGGNGGAAGSHQKHDAYYPVASTGCAKCHANHQAEPNPFIHATSAGRRPLVMKVLGSQGAFGSYSGPVGDYLPKSQTNQFGYCSNTYCHSNGTSVASGITTPNRTPVWGSGSITCTACHKTPPDYPTGTPKANSHLAHANHGASTCNKCHAGTTTDGSTIANTGLHANHSFDVTPGTGVTFDYTYASTGGTCTNVSCHTSGSAVWGGGGPTGLCKTCHGYSLGYEYESGKFGGGKGTWKSHATHTQSDTGNVRGPHVDCDACHDVARFPFFKSGTDGNGDGKYNLAETDVCDACHSPGGAYNGVTDPIVGAKNNWPLGVYDGTALRPGKENWCYTCHDSIPAVVKGETAPNKLGNGTTYGYLVTGHGKTGSYSKMAWQDSTAGGNPGANRGCMDCHDSTKGHINTGSSNSRLKAGYENQNNANCYQCHKTGGMANNAPLFYTTTTAYRASAHKTKLCTECHDVHGSTGAYPGMTKADKQALCSQCHSNGGHPGVGTKSFTVDGKNYTLQCVSCHNVHVITGKYADAAQNKSPVSRILDNTHAWGGATSEKMNAYAGSGTYRTPTGESFTGAQLPDYATFCLDCHGTNSSGSVYFGINWDADNHGKVSSNQPNGYGTCPNWYTCGKAFGWDNDDCVSDQATCWPVIPRGAADQLFSREPYTHTQRIAGANFVLSCTDCHKGHGTGTLGRSNVNGGSFTSNWNNMCNNCHYYYSDWHAGMSCGNASCHVSSRMSSTGTVTPHSMNSGSGSGGTRSFDPSLVLNMKFENNLNDNGNFRLNSKWFSDSTNYPSIVPGSFAGGKSGNAVNLNGNNVIQVGTENANWSTDAGYHGTWVYTEMKYNTSMEAWVNPTVDQSYHTIFSKHVGYADGGYEFALQKVGGTLRVVFYMQADNNEGAQDGRAGLRGAYSTVTVPLNAWTHVAATFDRNGPNRNSGDPSVGRIRIYVNGLDVTTSDSSGNFMQPGPNETSIYAYSENSSWNQSICYDGHWCASEFSIGGFPWQNRFTGMLDEAKVWNITKDAAFFSTYDAQTAPFISNVEGLVGSNQLTVTFSEGVYTNTGSSGALVPEDLVLTDTNNDNPRTITGVTHTAGSTTAVITMSQTLNVADVGADLLAAASNAIFDKYNNAAGTAGVTIGLSSQCPTSPITIQLNEASGSSFVMDTQGILYGAVYGGASTLTGSAYSGGGDNSGRYIDFPYNSACLQADRKMTIEARVKPTGISGTSNYVRRILARDGNGNFQISLWRNDSVSDQDPPSGVVMVALWVRPDDPNPYPSNLWKGILTDFNACPIVTDHWYQIKAVWDSDATGIPVKVFMDDQGTDGNGAGKNWSGYIDCTDTDQSQMPAASRVKHGDTLPKANQTFKIGANLGDSTLNLFNGLIDWIKWKDTVSDDSVLDVPSQYATIQAAIDAAVSGNNVVVSNGLYSENINFNGKAITVRSLNGAALTTIQGTGANSPVVTFSNAETASAVLDGFTIDNQAPAGTASRGIYISGTAAPTIQNSIITGNNVGSATDCAGIYINGSTPTPVKLINSTVSNNVGRHATGIYVLGGADIEITNTTIDNNISNSTVADGGGINVTGAGSTVSMTGGSITNNSARHGSGIYISADADVTLTNVTIDNNDTNNSSLGDGSGIYVTGSGSTLTMTGGSITNGAGRNGAGLAVYSSAEASLTGTTLNSNTSSNGGAIYMTGTTLTIDSSAIRGNSASTNGGGVYSFGGTTTIRNSDITGNTSATDGGGAIVTGSTTLNIYNSTVAGNYAGSGANGGGGIRNNSATLNLENAILFGNTAAAGASKAGISTSGTTTINYSSYQAITGTWSGANNRTVGEDPLFQSFGAGDQAGSGTPKTSGNFHLTASSPVINQGTNNGYTPDIDGDGRPQGSGYDMGSDEYVGP